MSDDFDLERFVEAQAGGVHEQAVAELRAGAKRSHWMWFVFPQVEGLGRSATAQQYAIGSLAEARAYLAHPVLGPRLRESAAAARDFAGTPEQLDLSPIGTGKSPTASDQQKAASAAATSAAVTPIARASRRVDQPTNGTRTVAITARPASGAARGR